MTDWREEHVTDRADMADAYVLLDEGEVRVEVCESCFQVPCECAQLADDLEFFKQHRRSHRPAPAQRQGR